MNHHRIPTIPWWIYAAAALMLLVATWAHAQELQTPLALCQQELSGWKQLSAGQVTVLQVENQKLAQQAADLRKQVSDLEAKLKPAAPEPKK